MNKKQDKPLITLMELWLKIYKNKLLVLIVTLVFAAVVIVTERIYTNESITLDTRFEYSFLNIEEQLYPDQEPFLVADIISYNSLEKVKASDERFNDIDIEKMLSTKDIRILQLIQTTQSSRSTIPGVFTISIKQKYFKSSEIARDFIRTLVQNVILDAREKNKIFEISNYLDTVDDLEYLDGFNVYQNQFSLILQGFNDIQAAYGNVLVNDNQRIGEIKNSFQNWWEMINISALKVKFTQTPVIKNDAYLVRLQDMQSLLQRESEFINLHIEALMVQVTAILTQGENIQQIPTLEAKIQQLVSEDQSIQRRIADNQLIIDAGNSNTLSPEDALYIQEIHTTLLAHIELYNEIYVGLLNRDTFVQFYSGINNVYDVSEARSIFLVAIAGLFGGLVGSMAIVIIKEAVIDYKKKQVVVTNQ